MSATKIEWADAVWNPVTGCTPISEGCAHCYAQRMAKRLAGRCGYPADDPFRVTCHPDRLEQPISWRKLRRVFVCSMGDLFHEDVPDSFIRSVFDTIHMCCWRSHTFMFLTKRPARMKRAIGDYFVGGPPRRWWLGVTAESQAKADERIPILLDTPAARRFVSVEPMLGPVDLERPRAGADLGEICQPWLIQGLDWVICGGETGPGARPMHPDWPRSLRDQCQAAGVPFFFKQWGEYGPEQTKPVAYTPVKTGGHSMEDPVPMYRLGKKAAGRELDGRTWEEVPS